MAFFDAFYDFVCPLAIKTDAILETASVFFELQNSSDFRAVWLRFFCVSVQGPAAEGGAS